MRISIRHWTLGAILTLAGCASAVNLNNALFSRLDNRGPVTLSPDNPYLAANVLLSKEMEKSPELKGFIDHMGYPQALEVKQSLFSSNLMYLYYARDNTMYSLEDLYGTWLIKGPSEIPIEKQQIVTRSTAQVGNYGKVASAEKNSGRSPDENVNNSIVEKKIAPAPARSPDRPDSNSNPKSTRTADLGPQAELTPKGDLVHYVTYPGESLSIIARWYTDDRANAGSIARINQIQDPNTLSIGDTIVIPAYLLKSTRRLTEAGVKGMLEQASRERQGQ